MALREEGGREREPRLREFWEKEESMTGSHCHRGKSSEGFLNKDLILKELNILPGQIILDAGCGNGYMSKKFSRLLNNTGKVFALDPDEEAIKKLKKETQGTNIEPIEAEITATTPLEKSSIDLIYLSTVLHGFSKGQIDSFNKEVKRLLKPNGRLAVIEIHKHNTPFGPPLHIRFSPEELKQAINLTPKSLVEVGQYFYMQIFENNSQNN
jgi:ubiquinone/menaquinone biosynthesis C-methylase UbiE